MLSSTILFGLFASLASTVHGHGTITAVTGANGITAAGMGIDPSTPRDGSRARPFQQDTSVIRDREIASGRTGPCGRTAIGGNNDVAAEVASAASDGLPSLSEDGTLTMTLHQINQDGGGPYACDISTDASGTNFQPMTIVTQVPGIRGFSAATAQDFPLRPLLALLALVVRTVTHALSDAATIPPPDHSDPAQLSLIVTNPESGAVAANAVPQTPANNGGGGGFRGLFGAFGNKKRSVDQDNKKRALPRKDVFRSDFDYTSQSYDRIHLGKWYRFASRTRALGYNSLGQKVIPFSFSPRARDFGLDQSIP
ncbi:1967_t:CDS:2 [Acaulospora colombiana]|uniref:1967_t:CDS:1 n=1 Tax=Acaulospora colombiana TaxID=27376 RepID=A0ACA9KI66_9GLOM|nr:1967_t:CDS:2 [Acaulospora colombiana]